MSLLQNLEGEDGSLAQGDGCGHEEGRGSGLQTLITGQTLGRGELRGSAPQQAVGPVLKALRAFEVRQKAEDSWVFREHSEQKQPPPFSPPTPKCSFLGTGPWAHSHTRRARVCLLLAELSTACHTRPCSVRG